MEMGEKIYQLRMKNNMTLEELGKKVGVGKSTVRKWEKGMIANMRRDKIAKLATALNVSPAYLMGWEETPTENIKIVKIPIYGSIAAGIPISANTDIVGYVYDTEGLFDPDTHFCLEIKGDSMTPDFHEGDKVIVHSQPDAETGEVVAVMIDGCEATCKRLKKYEDSIALVSNNPLYEPMIFTAEEIASLLVQIMGKVVELRRKY